MQELYSVSYVVRLLGLFSGVKMGVVEGRVVGREGGEGGGGEKERGEGNSSTQPCLQPNKPTLVAPPPTWCM